MITPDQAYEILSEANPAPVVHRSRHLSADIALADAKAAADSSVGPVGTVSPLPRWRGLAVAAVAFAVVLAIGIITALLLADVGEVVDDPPVPTTVLPAPTTVPDESAETIPAETLQLVEHFAQVYNSGDFDAVTELLAPGVTKVRRRGNDGPTTASQEESRIRYQIESELNTRLTFTRCQSLGPDRVSCAVERVDDLRRSLGVEPFADIRFRFQFEDGLITEWFESVPESNEYDVMVIGPFIRWLTETHPEIPNPKPAVGAPWRVDAGIEVQIAELVDEWAASLGVTLDD